jgi:hypothetical protein
MQKLGKSGVSESCVAGALQSLQRGLGKRRTVGSGKVPCFRETETMSNVSEGFSVWICPLQSIADFSQAPQQHISGRAHAKELNAARPEGMGAHSDQLT